MVGFLTRYAKWLHTGWPAGTVERLPEVNEDGSTRVPGLYIVGDLTGIPLLKFAADSGARAVITITGEAEFSRRRGDRSSGVQRLHDLVIIGGGVSGMAAALQARKEGLDFVLLEAHEPFSTIVNFPKAKPIYAYPTGMTPAGDIQFRARIKEDLLAELRAQTIEQGIIPQLGRSTRIRRDGSHLVVELDAQPELRALRVIVAIGRSGDFRRLGIEGEDLGKVSNRLHDPGAFRGQRVLVVGGGDSAVEAAMALAENGARVTLTYRGREFSRPKPENLDRLMRARANPAQSLQVFMQSKVERIDDRAVTLSSTEGQKTIENDAVFTLLGREAPLDFFRRSGVPVHGDWQLASKLSFAAILLLAIFVYHWKTSAGIPIYDFFKSNHWFPFNIATPRNPSSLLGTIALSAQTPSFYYSLAYSMAVTIFGVARIRRRKTPYVRAQTITLTLIQVIPLFLLPFVLLPWIGHNGGFDAGFAKTLADNLFPLTQLDPHGREYWRSVGFILAWPLMFWNVFTDQPLTWWLIISFVQTFVIIPTMVYFWGKGAYCGWVCSCGALSETMGDTLRQKMPHGPRWNRLNMIGQYVLWAAFVILILRTLSWAMPDSAIGQGIRTAYMALLLGKNASWAALPFPINLFNYSWIVDLTLAGIVGVGFYTRYSGRVWCRFACPLAALMHVYARFSRFRILADKKKCISCNVCTSVCHQGIDVMNFANQGLPMADVECVRCSACVQSCPTGVLEFGQVDPKSGRVISVDALAASPVRATEAG